MLLKKTCYFAFIRSLDSGSPFVFSKLNDPFNKVIYFVFGIHFTDAGLVQVVSINVTLKTLYENHIQSYYENMLVIIVWYNSMRKR